MGHLKDKYTKEYFLGFFDEKTCRKVGVSGFESFKEGRIDKRFRPFLIGLNLKGKEVLDIGCGRGEIVNGCAKKGAKRVVGIDFSKASIEISSEFNKDNPNVKLIEMEAKDIKFKNEFDVIFMIEVIKHIPDEEMQIVYPKVYSALKKEGILILHDPIYKSPDSKDPSDFTPSVCGIHCNKQTKEKLSNDLKKHKFRKYSLNVWSKSDKFPLSLFLYANTQILYANTQNLIFFLSLLPCRISHPRRTLAGLRRRIESFLGIKTDRYKNIG